ncbi:hypothetical protein CLAIMM_09765 [Cladophialophora immunda]|nr:hypothetical protein CLAIMM_09765 [Cladophialophora immunda]
MLVLIAGMSGRLGHLLAFAALRRGLQVRGLGRSPGAVKADLACSLESFITTTAYYDVPALRRAVTGVDAVICAYSPTPQMYLEAQLLLLREAENAGVKIFHAQTWNLNWHGIQFGDMEYYDAQISFCRQVELTSKIRPVYVFSGVFGEQLWGPLSGTFPTKRSDGTWNTKYPWTSMKNCAEFSIELLTTEKDVVDGKGGFFFVRSGYNTVREFAEVYERLKQVKVELIRKGSSEDLHAKVQELRRTNSPRRHCKWLGLLVADLAEQGKWSIGDYKIFENIQVDTIEDIIQEIDPEACETTKAA